MKHFISINGSKTHLTDEQVKALGFSIESPLTRLVEAIRNGNAREHYNIHDTFNVGGIDYEIIGFDHDKSADNETAPTVTLMAKTLTPCRQMHSKACERGWIDTELREWLNGEYFNQLPEELARYICPAKKTTRNYKGAAYETTDRLFIPSESELFGSAIYSGYEDGLRYEAFATSADRVREDAEGDADWYWTRSFLGSDSTHAAYVYQYGTAIRHIASFSAIRAPVCFLIA